MRYSIFKILIFLLVASKARAQDVEVDRLMEGELKMTFPSIYFKHQSADYATMPYAVDSCFKFVASHFEDDINSLVIWQDSIETKELTSKRVKKLKAGLSKYKRTGGIEIHSMGKEQKISRRTINMTSDSTKMKHLLSLNSVFEISKTRIRDKKGFARKNHVELPRPWCWGCWKSGFHTRERRQLRKIRANKK